MLSLKTLNRTRKRLKQKATLGSLLVVMMLFGLFLEAYMHNFNLVYIVLFFVFALAFVASPVGINNFTGLSLTLEESDRLFANTDSKVYLALQNDNTYSSYALKLSCMEEEHFVPLLAPHEKEIIPLSFQPKSRGELQIAPCHIESLFPFATVRFMLYLPSLDTKPVYPEPKGITLEAFLRRQRGDFGEESDFEGIISYTESAPMSKIHWPSIAKGESAIKKFKHEIPLEELIFDFYEAGENDEARLSQLTLWIMECEAQQLPFQIIMPNEHYDSKRDTIEEILGKLAIY